MTQDQQFGGRTAIVTGAGSGIGRASALRFAREGARVIAADVSAERLDGLVAEEPDLDLVPVVGDVTTEDMDGFLPAAEVDDRTWDLVFAVNVTAVMRLTRAVLPLMVEAGKGAIVNIASEAALRGSAAGLAYTASKHAVAGMTKNTAVLYAGQGIRVNAVAPGATNTAIEAPMRSELTGRVLGPIMQTIVPAPVEADEMANSVIWLASDQASNVNGVILASDGGWSAI
jgi:NAD(P)-dependent dehydrogenase (short-subunit alcohol dehydrogenase family)